MAETMTERTAHTSRLHRHRNRVQAARAAMDQAAADTVAAHYAGRAAATAEELPSAPVGGSPHQGPPPPD